MTDDGETAARILDLMADQHYELMCLASALEELHDPRKEIAPDRFDTVGEEYAARLSGIKRRDRELAQAYADLPPDRALGDDAPDDLHRSLMQLSRALGLAEGISQHPVDGTVDMTTRLQELLGEHRETWHPSQPTTPE